MHQLSPDLFYDLLTIWFAPPSPRMFSLSSRWSNTPKWVPCERLSFLLLNQDLRSQTIGILLSLRGIHYRETRLLLFLHQHHFHPFTSVQINTLLRPCDSLQRCKVCNMPTPRWIPWKQFSLCQGCSQSCWKYTYMISKEEARRIASRLHVSLTTIPCLSDVFQSYFLSDILSICRLPSSRKIRQALFL